MTDFKRNYNYRHNSYIGTVCLVRSHLQKLLIARSISQQGKALVKNINPLLDLLEIDIRCYRKEPNGNLKDLRK